MSSYYPYQAFRTLFDVLVVGIQDDVDHLITKAYLSNPRPLIGKEQLEAASIQLGVSKAQKARTFLSTVLNRIKTDPSGKSYEIFLKILSDEEHLVYLAKQIKDEVERIEHSTCIPHNDRPDGASPFPHSTPTAGDGSFGMPKLEEPRKKQDSGFVSFTLKDDESDDDSQVEVAPRSPRIVGRVSSLTDFQQVTPGVVALRDEEDENIPIEESDRDQRGVTDTQEPGADATVHPILVGDSAESSIHRVHEGLRVAGSAIATLQEEKDDLRSELADSKEAERKKGELVQELRQEKDRSEQQLLCKLQELEKMRKVKNSETDDLKGQLQKKDKEVEMYKEQVMMKELEIEEFGKERIKAFQNEPVHKEHQEMKETYEARIRELKKTVKAAKEQKSIAVLEKAQIEVHQAQMEKEYTEMILKNEREVNQLQLQLLKIHRELTQERLRNAEMIAEKGRQEWIESRSVIEQQQNTIAERNAKITELKKEILSIKTGDEKPPPENQSKERTKTEPDEPQEVLKPQALFAEHQMVLLELEKALRNGYILTNLTTCLASGAPGVGKTLLLHFLFRELPPLLRISTACIEQAQRAILRALPAGDADCKPVSSKQLKGMIASDLKAGVSLEVPDPLSETLDDQSSHQSGHLEKIAVPKPQQPDSTTTSPIPLPSVDMKDNFNIEGNETRDSQSQAQGKHDVPTVSSATPLKGSTVGDLRQLPETSEIMKLMETSSGSQQLHEVHWVHFIDSGGQAQFMDILPAFARNISLQLPIVKLSEKLADVPAATYYDDQGKCHDLGHFIRTNEQLLIQALHFAKFHQPRFPFPNLEQTPDHPKVMVVGTFKDQENQEETIEDKDKLLMRSLELFQKQQILIPRSDREMIFPVDNTKAGLTPEDPVASELRTAIMKHAPRLRLKMPPQWYLLELELRKLGLKVISKDECWAIAKKLQFESEAAFDAALRYLHDANFFLYYPDILSDIVIVDPSAVIDIITQLFEKHIKLREAPESDSHMISTEDERFRDQAVFTVETIESCHVSYNKTLLPNESLMNLLQHRHIVAKIAPEMLGGVTSFFMPSLLQESHTSEIIPPGVATPLYIIYPGNQCTPSGLYCAFMVGLLSSKGRFQWQIHSLHSTPIVNLLKNRIDFTINDRPGLVTLVNAKTHYEVHASSDFPANLVHHLLSLIDDSLKLACSRFSYRVAHQFAFPCSCGDSPSHPAILINRTTAIVKCTQNPKYTEVMSKKQKLWLPQMKIKQEVRAEQDETLPIEETKPAIKQQEESMMAEKKDERRIFLQKLQQFWEEEDEAAAKKDDQLAQKEEEIAKMVKQLTEKDDQLTQREEEIEFLKAEVEELRNVTTTDYLRGVEVVAGTSFHLTGRKQTHVWVGHGLRLHVPEGALPPDHTGCRVDIRASLAGQFEFPEGSRPVSGMYWLSCTEKFLLPVTLELQHCAIARDATECSRLRFAIAKCSQPELPYKFKPLDRGRFTSNSSYGSISLSQFSVVVITEQPSKEPLPLVCCAKLFYLIETMSQWQLDFIITRDLELCHKYVDSYYAAAKRGPHFPVKFEGDEISLGIPDDATVVEEGWKITPLAPPLITKEQVDSYENGKLIPTCQLLVRWIKKQSPVNLEYKVNLLGAKKPHTYFHLHSPTVGGRASASEPTNDGGESPESKTIRTNLTKITGILSFAVRPLWFAQKLEEEALMDDATSRVVLGMPDPDSVSVLMNAVKAQIKRTSRPVDAFTKFIRILHNNTALKSLLQRLLKEYGKNGGNVGALQEQLDSQHESDD